MMFETIKVKMWDESGRQIAVMKVKDIQEARDKIDEVFKKKLNK